MKQRAIQAAPFDGPEHRAARGPNGFRLCRWCGKETPGPRRKWCSQECVDQYLIRKGGADAAAKVFERDRGVCARCGLDTEGLDRLFKDAAKRNGSKNHGFGGYGPVAESRRRMGFRDIGKLYDVDHVVPVAEGGGACGLENLRTLCTPCHKAVTAELAARLAEARRRQREAAGREVQAVIAPVEPF